MDVNLQPDFKPVEPKLERAEYRTPEEKVIRDSKNLWRGQAKNYYEVARQRVRIFSRNCLVFYREKKAEIKHYALVSLGLLFIVVLFQNIENSQFELLFWSFSAPKIVLFFVMIGFGVALGFWGRGKIEKSADGYDLDSKETLH